MVTIIPSIDIRRFQLVEAILETSMGVIVFELCAPLQLFSPLSFKLEANEQIMISKLCFSNT